MTAPRQFESEVEETLTDIAEAMEQVDLAIKRYRDKAVMWKTISILLCDALKTFIEDTDGIIFREEIRAYHSAQSLIEASVNDNIPIKHDGHYLHLWAMHEVTRIMDEMGIDEGDSTVFNALFNALLRSPQSIINLIGTPVIETDFFEEKI